MNMKKERVLLGMSGGTDSSMAACLLQQQGYEVVGITFRFFEKDGDTAYLEEAAGLCARLGVEHLVYDAREEFRQKIIRYFISEYMNGRTPVPCMVCNNLLKWPLMGKIADEKGIFFIASGHYARRVTVDGRPYVRSGADADKDQSFFLWGIPPRLLPRILFPLGNYTKTAIRQMARDRGLDRIAEKKESMGVCFCPGDYRRFLRENTEPGAIHPGFYRDVSGTVLGKHEGFPFYTVGQRRGLGIRYQYPVFVREIIPSTNTVVIARSDQMYKKSLSLISCVFVEIADFIGEKVTCRIRYRKQRTDCSVEILPGERAVVHFDSPVHSVAPGQSAVFYDGDRVLGGGIIHQAYD